MVDLTYIHFVYSTNNGRLTACGVCLRHRCTENLEEVNCPRCDRIIKETNFLELIKEEL